MTRFSPFAQSGPRWFSIAAHRPFLDDLAAGVLDALGGAGPEVLTEAVVLVPTRRAGRSLAEAFLKAAGGRPVLLPQIRAVGDLEEGEPPFEPGDLVLDLAPAIDPLRRRFELARLCAEHAPLIGRSLDAGQALDMADALGGFLDSLELEEVPADRGLDGLVLAEMAAHWEAAEAFLSAARTSWPARLAALGLSDPQARRVALLRRLADQWRERPPTAPLIAAGSTGSTPAVADLLAVVASAPQGCVVLPGLDLTLADSAWDLIDEQHPQGALRRLLLRTDTPRAAVRAWPAGGAGGGEARRRLVAEAMRPAAATADWLAQIRKLEAEHRETGVDPVAAGLEGLHLVASRTEDQTAAAAALLMRETLETPGATCALVTPDLALARRVTARLGRWGVVPDSSAGAALTQFPIGVLLSLMTRLASEPLEPAAALALLKHPMSRLAVSFEQPKRVVETLERRAFRGGRPADWSVARARLDERAAYERDQTPPDAARLATLDEARALTYRAEAAIAPLEALFAGGTASSDAAARALAEAVEAVAGAGPAWAAAPGEAAAALLAGLIEHGGALPPVTAGGFAALVETLLTETTVRAGGATHPRLRILGTIEGRLVRADRMILAGLEEGVWPRAAPTDPFLSRPMRSALGLPPPERRVGVSAHEFAQAASAPDVYLLHSERRGGQPAVRSRWLWRLDMLTRGAKRELPQRPELTQWVRALDAPPPGPPRYAPRPAPTPPVELRPRSMYVTRVERWVRDPYSIYARDILKLKALDRPDASVEAIARGNAVHKAVERLVLLHPYDLPEDGEQVIEALILEELQNHGFTGHIMARETPLARNAARWLAGFERARRARGVEFLIEQTGAITIPAAGGDFTLSAKADRIELAAHGAAIMDFKTGAAPTKKEMLAGWSPQLTLTGAILADGGFEKSPAVEATELTYVRVTGRRTPGEEICRASGEEAQYLCRRALEGLSARIARFDDQATPYVSWAAPQFQGKYGGDYDHLARVWEWHVAGAESDDAGGGE